MERKIDLLKAMRTFVVVVDKLSFSAAARELNIVVSAVSRQVSDLEKHFDCILLYRTTRAMKLTPEGQHYLDEFKAVLERLDNLELSATQRQHKVAGRLRITSAFNIDQLGIQHVVADFLRQYPDVQLSWVLVNRYVNLIEEGFDLALRVGQLSDSGFIARHYLSIKILMVASPDYLAEHGSPDHPKALSKHRWLVDSSNRQPGRVHYQENGKQHQLSVNGHVDVNQGTLLADFAAAGLGIAQLPEFMLRRHLQQGKLVPILEEYQLPALDVSLVYPASKLTDPTLRAFIDHLLAHKHLSTE
ncbi:DNA-binding transcriptional regulator, LysR family [Ferrimonas sediminum]|uniref:DNA-binding transcriptional regulator, LysR family n=1 Tax=Ferrimonas sediminum TaxID=718193 RepID=A0A1G8YC74_9GAMM|nr:LysR family transcriptional regulator [Ferrimonas sediminum]SDK00014.1 DNA-binding transcriptional regulator, LysR family [Ferrimonas sediminum]